jgi:hypothetical protein
VNAKKGMDLSMQEKFSQRKVVTKVQTPEIAKHELKASGMFALGNYISGKSESYNLTVKPIASSTTTTSLLLVSRTVIGQYMSKNKKLNVARRKRRKK